VVAEVTTIRKHWLDLVLVAIALVNLALGQYLWAGLLAAVAVIGAAMRQFWPRRIEAGRAVPSTRVFVTFLVGTIAVGVLMTVLAVEDRNGAGPFAIVAAVGCACFAVATVVAILKLRRAEKRNAGQD
jgi:membrane associated rhomboid family serine protease